MIRRAVVLSILLVVALTTPAAAQPFGFPRFDREGPGSATPPTVSAPSWILYDSSTGAVLASRNASELRAPASITKMMTVLIALENGDLDDMVQVTARAAATGEREIGIWAGESVSLGALVRAAMVHSANDAATAIAEHIGGSVENFVMMMNARAQELGMTRTTFRNPHGLDADGHMTTAEDMLKLALEGMKRSDFRDLVSARVVVFPNAPDGSRRIGTASNLLLGAYDGANGVKTGFTNRARLTFVASAQRDGRELYVVVLGSEGQRAHFADARALLSFGFNDLRMYGFLGGQPVRSTMLAATPSPTRTAASLESLVHLSGEGLLTIEVPDEIPEPEPVIETIYRESAHAPAGVWGALVYWARSLVGW